MVLLIPIFAMVFLLMAAFWFVRLVSLLVALAIALGRLVWFIVRIPVWICEFAWR